jgi:protein-arginine kinase activator protein McsA
MQFLQEGIEAQDFFRAAIVRHCGKTLAAKVSDRNAGPAVVQIVGHTN